MTCFEEMTLIPDAFVTFSASDSKRGKALGCFFSVVLSAESDRCENVRRVFRELQDSEVEVIATTHKIKCESFCCSLLQFHEVIHGDGCFLCGWKKQP